MEHALRGGCGFLHGDIRLSYQDRTRLLLGNASVNGRGGCVRCSRSIGGDGWFTTRTTSCEIETTEGLFSRLDFGSSRTTFLIPFAVIVTGTVVFVRMIDLVIVGVTSMIPASRLLNNNWFLMGFTIAMTDLD